MATSGPAIARATTTSAALLQRHGLPRLTLQQVQSFFLSKQLTSVQLFHYCRTLQIALEPLLHAYSYIPPIDGPLAQAEAADLRLERKGGCPLTGIPLAIKANLAVRDWPLTAGSPKILCPTTPVGYTADVIEACDSAGAVFMGHTTMDAFGMGSVGYHTETRNPGNVLKSTDSYDAATVLDILHLPVEAIQEAIMEQQESSCDDSDFPFYLPGGSSSGSAVAVAAGSAIVAIGSDTGGSVRFPAALNGIVGFKPSYGVLSRHGLVSYASSFDTVGILGRTPSCVHATLECILKQQQNEDYRVRDSTQRAAAYTKNLVQSLQESSLYESRDLDRLRVGLPPAFAIEECSDAVRRAWNEGAKQLEERGATIVDEMTNVLRPELLQQALAAYYVLVSAEAASNLSRYDGLRFGTTAPSETSKENRSFTASHGEDATTLTPLERQYGTYRIQGFDREVIRRILCGTAVLSSDQFSTYYETATQVRAALTDAMRRILTDDVDVLLVPTSLQTTPPVKELHLHDDEDSATTTAVLANDILTVPMSLAGLPTIAVPISTSGDPVLFQPSLQLVGRTDDVVLRAARALSSTM